MFLGTFEKQLDSKRRIVVPAEFRAAAGPFGGVFCFPSIEAECIEGGGKPLFDEYEALIDSLPFGDPMRLPLEHMVFGGMKELSFDTAGRITLPENLCDDLGITDWVVVVGLRRRFQIWDREAYRAHHAEVGKTARSGLAGLADLRRAQQTAQRAGGAAP